MRIDPSTYQEAFEEGKPLLSWGPYQGDNHVREHHRIESNKTDRQTKIERNTKTDRQTDRQTDKETRRQTDIHHQL